jgi:hypothetical protein
MDDLTRAEAAHQRDLRLAELIQALTRYDRAKAQYRNRRKILAAEYPDRGTFLVRARSSSGRATTCCTGRPSPTAPGTPPRSRRSAPPSWRSRR